MCVVHLKKPSLIMIPWRKISTFISTSLTLRTILPKTQLYGSYLNACTSPPRIVSQSLKSDKFHTPDIRTLNNKITHLIRCNRIEEARMLFDKSKLRNTVTWNSMLTGYVKRREMVKARQLFDEMPSRDIVSWNVMISGYVGSGYLEEGRFLFDRMVDRDFVSWNTMISGYAKNGRMEQALSVFNSMVEKNVVSWNAMMTGFLQNGDVRNAIGFFEKMPQRDAASLSALVFGLIQNGELDEAARILDETTLEKDDRLDLVHAYNTLIAGYGQGGRVDDARSLFDRIPCNCGCGRGRVDNGKLKRNVVSWNTMIMCYVKVGDIVSARDLFDQMMERDTCSWNTMISGYVRMSDMDEASNLFRKMPNPDTFSWNSMITGFAEMGNMKLARDVFERMPGKNRISWNSIIAACEKNKDYEGAIELFVNMQLEGEKRDRHTLSSLMSICAEVVALQLGMQIHQQVIKIVTPDVPLNNSLITMYARCGAIIEARAVFNEMKFHKDVISWNAMIGGYASHGFATEALELFASMKKLLVQPTYITFISVLSACAHAGLVEQGRMHFKSMVSEFGIEPRVEHFASLVDVLGRHGKVEEAMDVINSMPFEPDKAVWGALLSACNVHNNAKFAQVAAKALMRLEPESSTPYVLLYNIYAAIGQWDNATEIRMLMERSNIRKEAGHSWV